MVGSHLSQEEQEQMTFKFYRRLLACPLYRAQLEANDHLLPIFFVRFMGEELLLLSWSR